MYRLASATLLRITALALIVPIAACGKKDEAYTEPTAADTASAATAAATSLEVTDFEIGKGLNTDKTLKEKTADFGVRDTIYFVVKTEGASPGAKLAAKWTFKPAQIVSESSQDIAPTGGVARHEFHMAKASAWPKGDYKVEVMLDGIGRGTQDFTIK